MSEKIEIVCRDNEKKRLDLFISENYPVSRNAAANLIKDGKVILNGILPSKKDSVKSGDVIVLTIEEEKPFSPVPKNIPLDIIYQNDELLVVNKPKGMVVHPGAGKEEDTLVSALLYICGKDGLSSLGGADRPGIVHRIDKDTSGLLVCAKNNAAHEFLSEQFKVHSIERTYYAVCHGHFKNASGTVNAPLGRHPADRKKICITDRNSKEAITHYEVLEQFRGFSLVKCNLETGRTHQIRVHMAYLNHPVAGDEIYGPKKGVSLNGQCLHAKSLGFINPSDKEFLQFDSPLPKYFEDFLQKLRSQSL